jgi:hypothetical protein
MYTDFIEQLEQAFTQSLDIMNAPYWDEFCRVGDAVAYRKSSDKGVDYLKVDGLSASKARDLCRAVYDGFVGAAYATDDVEECREVTVFNDSSKLLYVRNKSLGPVSPREVYLILTVLGVEEGIYCIAGKSVEHPALPLDSSCIKAEVSALLFTFQDSGYGLCRIGYLLHSDAGGSVPEFLVNAFLSDRVSSFVEQIKAAEGSVKAVASLN